MIQIIDGDLLNSNENIICHQVNCQGVMGRGIARQIKDRYPHVYLQYKDVCDKYPDKKELLGKIQTISSSENGSGNGSIFDILPTIVNIFGQETYGRNGVYTNYDALKLAFEQVAIMPLCKNSWYGSSIAMPFNIGCGFGGGDWDVVYKIMESVFMNVTLNLYRL